MNDLLRKLLTYIVSRLQDEEAAISSIRLIKLLYLIDLEHTAKFGAPLTKINWMFYKHGPYFMEWPTVVRGASLDINPEEIKTESGYQATTYRTYEEPKLDKFIKRYASQVLVNRVLDQWMSDDLEVILEHVYQTEPMRQSKRGQALDLTFACDVIEAQKAHETADDIVTFDEMLEELNLSAEDLEDIELDELE